MRFHIKGLTNVSEDFLSGWRSLGTFRRLDNLPLFPSSFSCDFCRPMLTEFVFILFWSSWTRPDTVKIVHGLGDSVAVAVGCLEMRLSYSSVLVSSFILLPWLSLVLFYASDASILLFLLDLTMAVDVDTFVRACMHCLSTSYGKKVPRPFRLANNRCSPISILHYAYVHFGSSLYGKSMC